MTRSPIRGKDNNAITRSVTISIAHGEQIHLTVILDWITDLTGYTITATVAEGANEAGDGTEVPKDEDATLTVTTLPIIDADVADNTFKMVLPADLIDAWDQKPTPDDPVYGFFGLSIADPGVGVAQQKFVPIRGLIEVRYNPGESV